MPLSEFALIARFFGAPLTERPEVVLGVGDDAALLALPPDRTVVVDAAQWLAGRDFAAEDAPASVGHRALAGALARLAARGAEPLGFTLALTLPRVDEAWLGAFSDALAALASRHRVALIGGDTTRGPLSITLHTQGLAAPGGPVPGRGAAAGELLYVSGTFGGATLALLQRQGEVQLPAGPRREAESSLDRPEPPRGLGPVLAGLATAARTLDDGLAVAVEGMLQARTGATVHLDRLPVAAILQAPLERAGGRSLLRNDPAPVGVCFSLPPSRQVELERRLADAGMEAAWVGIVDGAAGVRFVEASGRVVE